MKMRLKKLKSYNSIMDNSFHADWLDGTFEIALAKLIC